LDCNASSADIPSLYSLLGSSQRLKDSHQPLMEQLPELSFRQMLIRQHTPEEYQQMRQAVINKRHKRCLELEAQFRRLLREEAFYRKRNPTHWLMGWGMECLRQRISCLQELQQAVSDLVSYPAPDVADLYPPSPKPKKSRASKPNSRSRASKQSS